MVSLRGPRLGLHRRGNGKSVSLRGARRGHLRLVGRQPHELGARPRPREGARPGARRDLDAQRRQPPCREEGGGLGWAGTAHRAYLTRAGCLTRAGQRVHGPGRPRRVSKQECGLSISLRAPPRESPLATVALAGHGRASPAGPAPSGCLTRTDPRPARRRRVFPDGPARA